MGKLLLVSAVFALVSFGYSDLSAQKWELGGTLGLATYQGDLIPRDRGDLRFARFAYGAFVNYRLHPTLALRGSLMAGHIAANDKKYPNRPRSRRFDRGFNFTSPFTEGALLLEYDPFGLIRFSKEAGFRKIVSAYALAGVGVGFFNPDTDYNQSDTFIEPALITQDALEKTKRGYFTLPFGGGIKVDLSYHWSIGGEYLLRPTFRDYLDGVSLSGDPEDEDWYETYSIVVVYRFGAKAPAAVWKCLRYL